MPSRGEIDLDLEARFEKHAPGDLLERVALALASSLDVKEVLQRLVEMGREASSAQRCSIVLIEGSRLKPAAASSAQPDEDLWSVFRSMPPIELGSDQWQLLHSGRAIALDDARSSPHIPREWVERFSLRAVAIIPLLAHGEPCGAMAVDWPEVRTISPEELATLEAIGAYAGLAVYNARLHQGLAAKTRTLEHLIDVAGVLNWSSSLEQVLDHACVGFERVLGSTHCSVNLTDAGDPRRIRTLASRGEPWFTRHGEPVAPEELLPLDQIHQAAAGPIVYSHIGTPRDGTRAPVSVRSAALFPMFGPDGLLGAVIAGLPTDTGPGEAELEAGQTLAELAAAAIGRADLHGQLQRRLRQLELLSHLSEVVTGKASLEEIVSGVNQALAPELRTRLDAMVVASDDVRAAIGGTAPDGEEAAVIEAWRAAETEAEGSPPLALRAVPRGLLVPVTHRHHVVGALRVEVPQDEVGVSDAEFLVAIGGAFAEVVHRAMLGRALGESERRLAVLAERERIAQDLHDSAGQVLTGMGMKLANWLDEAPDETWRHRLATLLRLAGEGERELREAIYSLVFVEVQREGLGQSLHELGSRFSATTGIAVSVDIDGSAVALHPEQEDVLFRVAHEALSNVERHAEAATVRLTLDYRSSEACVVVEDDGIGFSTDARRLVTGDRLRFGLRGIERRVSDVGGMLLLENGESGGARLEARVPIPPTALGQTPLVAP